MDDSAGAIAPLYEADKSAVLAWSPMPDPAGGGPPWQHALNRESRSTIYYTGIRIVTLLLLA